MNVWQRIPLAVKILVPGLIAVAVIATAKPAPTPIPPAEAVLPVVSVVKAVPSAVHLSVRSQGTVMPRREIDVVAEVGGRITAVDNAFVGGGFFASDTALLQIDDRDYVVADKRTQAQVLHAEQLLSTERGRVRQAKREWRDLGNTEANNLFLRKPQLAAAEASLASAQAEQGKAKLDLERTQVSVPFRGRIRETFVDVGQYVAPGTRIATVYDTASAEIRLPLSDRHISLLDLPLNFQASASQAAPAVTVRGVIAGEPHTWAGRITRTEATVDTQSRMYYAVAEVSNPFTESGEVQKEAAVPLAIGLFVEADIAGRPLDNVIVLPRDAVFKRDQVYLLQATESDAYEVVALRVKVLQKTRDQVWIQALNTDDIPSGSSIVSGQQQYLAAGIMVTVSSEQASGPISELGSEPSSPNEAEL